jgi:murein DD-endopeptidase MepM/ murein hydrolase activator NlpD
VIDPSVREDGEPDPAVELEVEHRVNTGAPDLAPSPAPDLPAATLPPAEPPAAGPTEGGIYGGGGATDRAALPRAGRAREILLERAQAASRDSGSEPAGGLGDLDQVGKTEGETLADPEFGLPTARAPSAPLLGNPPGRLSPNWVAVFGTLLGVATVASLIALGMNLDVKLPAAGPTPSAMPSADSKPTLAPPVAPSVKPKRTRNKLPGPWRVADAKADPGLRIAESKVGSDPFLKALQKAGVELRETYRILTSMKGVRDFDRCKSSDRFVVLIERGSSKVKAFEYIVTAEEVYQSREGADGLLKGAKLDLKVERSQVSGALVYDGKSFDASAEQGGLERGLAKVVVKALDGHMALDEIERGSRIRVIAQEVTVLGEFARYSGVEAIEVRGPDASKPPFRVYYFAAGAERGYFNADGHSPYEGGWRKPIKDAPMTSPFNLKRMHPILKKTMPHLGIDFGAPTGTPVGAASYGTVETASYVGPTGNLVRIVHANGVETGYAHLSRFAEGLKVGDKVKRLQVIGYVGSTGRSTGPHLHFSARRNGAFIDPESLNLDSMRTLSKENRAAFNEVKTKYDAELEAIALPEPLIVPAAPSAGEEASAGTATSATTAPVGSAAAAAASNPMDPAQGEDEEDSSSPSAGPAAPSPGATPASKPGNAVYLSDKELLRLQGATDEGEVSE